MLVKNEIIIKLGKNRDLSNWRIFYNAMPAISIYSYCAHTCNILHIIIYKAEKPSVCLSVRIPFDIR